MYSVFVLEEMRVEYSIRRVINRHEYPSRNIRRALDTLIIARVIARKRSGKRERKLYLYRKIEEMKVLAAALKKSHVSQIVHVKRFFFCEINFKLVKEFVQKEKHERLDVCR